MATSGGVTTFPVDNGTYYYCNWQQSSQDVTNNRTLINYQYGVHCRYDYYVNALRIDYVNINGSQVKGSETYSYLGSGDHQLGNGSMWIDHNTDGTKAFNINLSGWVYEGGTTTGSQDFTLDAIPRNFTQTPTVTNTSVNAYGGSFRWNTSETADYVTYSINNGSEVQAYSGSGTSGTFSVGSLTPGTTYSIKIKARRQDSQMTMWSNSINFTTLGNFTRPPEVSQSSCTTTSSTFTWTTSETADLVDYYLDNSSTGRRVFYGSATSGTFTINGLTSNSSHTIKILARKKDSQLYYASSTVSFSTSSKTVRIRINGSWKDATPYVRVNSVWRVATPYTLENNIWKRGK